MKTGISPLVYGFAPPLRHGLQQSIASRFMYSLANGATNDLDIEIMTYKYDDISQ